MKVIEAVKEFLTSDGGQLSFARLSAGFLVLNLIGWEWYMVVTTGKLDSIVALIGAICALYGVNKIAENFGGGNGKGNA